MLLLPWTNNCLHRISKGALYCLALAITAIVNAQSIPGHKLGSENGIPEVQYIMFAGKDCDGFLWIGTVEGLVRFDGINVKVYNTINSGLADNNIQSDFFEDVSGDVWFTTVKALNRYRRKEDNIESFQFKDENNVLLQKDYRLFYLQPKSNSLWLKVGNRIYVAPVKSPSLAAPIPGIITNSVNFSPELSPNEELMGIYGAPWIVDKGIEYFYKENGNRWKSRTFLKESLFSKKIKPPVVTKISVENDSTAWLLTEKQGIIRFNKHQPSESRQYLPGGLLELSIRDVALVEDNQLALATKEAGLIYFTTDKTEYSFHGSYNQLNSEDKISPGLNSVFIDNEIVVKTTKDGIEYEPVKTTFGSGGVIYLKTTDKVNSIVEDSKGKVWVSTINHGVYRYDLNGVFEAQYKYQLNGITRVPFESISELSVDKKGTVWCLSKEAVSYFDPNKKEWRLVLASEIPKFKLLHFESGKKLVSTSAGMMDLSASSSGYTLTREVELKNHQGYNYITPLKTSNDELFLHLNLNELNIFHWANQRFRDVGNIPFDNQIYGCVETDGGDSVFIGTGNGLVLITSTGDGSFKKLELFQEDWEIGKTSVWQPVLDLNNDLWIPTTKGLWHYGTNSEVLLQYQKEDGLPNTDFSLFGHICASDGKIWLATIKGAIVFQPTALQPYPIPPRLHLESLSLNGTPLHRAEFGGNEMLKLPASTSHTLELKFIGVGYYLPEKTQIRYRLNYYNDESEWLVSGNPADIKLIKLPYGEFELEVQAIGANGNKSPIFTKSIIIPPPIYLRKWFIALSTGLVLLMIYGVFRAYLNMKLRKQKMAHERELAKQEERIRIAGELHDDLGSGLSTILFLAGDIMEEERNKEKKEKLHKVSASASSLFDNMRDIIWALDKEDDSLENLLGRLRNYASQYLKTNQLALDAHWPDEIPACELTGEKRRNILLIVKEALHNIIRHANATNATIRCRVEHGRLFLQIEDNGKGLPDFDHKKKGKGLDNMAKRAENLGGKISFSSMPDKGTSVILEVQL